MRLMLFLCFILSGLITGVNAAEGQLGAELDRSRIYQDETVTLVISAPGAAQDGDLDLSLLEKDFEVLGRSQSTRIRTINGRTETMTHWRISLAPEKTGKLTIPPIKLGGRASRPLSLEVRPAGERRDQPENREVFLTGEVEPNRGYAQQQFTYTVRLYFRVRLANSASLSEPKLNNARVEKLGDDRRYQGKIDGQTYTIIERRYAVFPEQPGQLEIPAQTFEGEIPVPRQNRSSSRSLFNDPVFDRFFDDFGGFDTKRVRSRNQAQIIEVLPRPADFPGDWWLPARDLTLEENWNPLQPTFRVGEPVTRTLTLKAVGVGKGQLPELPHPDLPGIKTYPDRARGEENLDGDWVTSLRQEKIALVPGQPGTYRLPEIRLPWWDVEADKLRHATLPAREIKVEPASGTTPTASTPTADREPIQARPVAGDRLENIPGEGPRLPATASPAPGFWPWLSGLLALGWGLTLLAWWWRHRSPPARNNTGRDQEESADLGQARQAVRRACLAGRAGDAAAELLRWARLRWPDHPPRNLRLLGEKLGDASAREQLFSLDRYRYAREGETWQGEECWRALDKPLRRAGQSRQEKPPARQPLPELYPRLAK